MLGEGEVGPLLNLGRRPRAAAVIWKMPMVAERRFRRLNVPRVAY